MKSTPDKMNALYSMETAVRFFNEHCFDTGYRVTRQTTPDNRRISLRVQTPRDDAYNAYPEIHLDDDWNGTGKLSFEIVTVGYSDHSLQQAERVYHGLECAIEIVKVLTSTAEGCGLQVHH